MSPSTNRTASRHAATAGATAAPRRAIGALLMLAACVARPTLAAEPALHFSQPVVLLGEVHDNATQHAIRLRAFEAWVAQGHRPVLLMEQFDRNRQPAIDRAVASIHGAPTAADADAVIDAGAPGRKGWNWAFYKPYVAVALRWNLPIVAANMGRDEARAVIADGLAAHGFDATVPPLLLAEQTAAVESSHCGLIGTAMAGKMAAAQIARDQFMAQQVETHAARGVLLLAGNGHLRNDIGVPHWLSPAVRSKTESVGVLEAGDGNAAAYDHTVFTAAQARPDPCEAMHATR